MVELVLSVMVVPVLPGGDRDPGGGVPGELVAAAADGGGGVPAAPAAPALPQHQSRAEAHRVYRSVFIHLYSLKANKTSSSHDINPSLSRTFGPKCGRTPVRYLLSALSVRRMPASAPYKFSISLLVPCVFLSFLGQTLLCTLLPPPLLAPSSYLPELLPEFKLPVELLVAGSFLLGILVSTTSSSLPRVQVRLEIT